MQTKRREERVPVRYFSQNSGTPHRAVTHLDPNNETRIRSLQHGRNALQQRGVQKKDRGQKGREWRHNIEFFVKKDRTGRERQHRDEENAKTVKQLTVVTCTDGQYGVHGRKAGVKIASRVLRDIDLYRNCCCYKCSCTVLAHRY